jgi:hypothetical protein
MQHRIFSLHERVFQQTLHRNGYFPYGFVRGLLTERHRWVVDWSTYAHRMCHYGSRPFESLADRGRRVFAAGVTPAKVVGPNYEEKEGCPGD